MVAKYSIERRCSREVIVFPLYLPHLGHILHRKVEEKDGKMWCPISEAFMSTEFAISRFVVPFIQREGWALFVDCDIVCKTDINELFDLANEQYAVMVVKHDLPTDGEPSLKMDGQIQSYYSRKNWSSVVLWNCSHPSHVRLKAMNRINTWPGRDLHAFRWLEDYEVGELPVEWNHLVDVYDHAKASLYHYTLGGPWIPEWKVSHWIEDIWLSEQRSLRQSFDG